MLETDCPSWRCLYNVSRTSEWESTSQKDTDSHAFRSYPRMSSCFACDMESRNVLNCEVTDDYAWSPYSVSLVVSACGRIFQGKPLLDAFVDAVR
ncbi:hypothetical protein PROFUN_11227 [Planoprotostelium fungivorum]|uniref:Uncharacterized protein n=1 Tax=Planoprotostelium fungivorum TaxID=1890364 RepID=A0A2P6NA45_9EUKA|nr:hypothetical protein PROFUN_11227 [Planoprotostelium fungivorum]